MSVFKYEKDADGIVTVTMDMTGPVNSMNEEYRSAMAETLDHPPNPDRLKAAVAEYRAEISAARYLEAFGLSLTSSDEGSSP